MAWQTEMVTILRWMVNDVASPQTYTDAQLQTSLAIAAQLVKSQLSFAVTYTIDIATPSISPDPTASPRDEAFIELTCLRAGCMIDKGLYRSKLGTTGIRVKIGSDEVDTRGNLDGYNTIFKEGLCKEYENRKWEYQTGQYVPGKIILTPFAGPNVAYIDSSERR